MPQIALLLSTLVWGATFPATKAVLEQVPPFSFLFVRFLLGTVLVLGIDSAYVPTRPDSARGRRPGQGLKRAQRARWRGQWRDAKGFRLYLMDGDRIVHLLSWHQVHNEAQLGEALKQVQEAGVMPEDSVRLLCRSGWRSVDRETRQGPVPPRPPSARL